MSVATKQKRVDELLRGAGDAINRSTPFEAERMALKALTLAHQIEDYTRMAEAVDPLLTARQSRLEQALSEQRVTIVRETITEKFKFDQGCYLVQPPQVGADARRLRMAALQAEVPVAVVCREPLTQLGQWPIVAIGTGATVRTKVQPPDDTDEPDMAWFTETMQMLGDDAAAGVDPGAEAAKRVRLILDRLDTVPDHEGIHLLLAQTCREAAKCAETAGKKSTKSKAKA